MSQKYDYGVFIGRFSPVHNGHVKVMMEALEQCDYLIVVIGSDNIARNTRNPFTASEREMLIRTATNFDQRILITSASDYPYNEPKWLAGIQRAVEDVIAEHSPGVTFSNPGWRDYKFNIALAGMYKDETSYYLNSFPQWSNSIAIQPGTFEGEVLSATGIRNKLFNGELSYDKTMDDRVRDMIISDMETRPDIWKRLKSDWNYEQKYESLWGKGPHVTIDSLVVQAGHILLIQRGQEYGHGLWAMPGGFINRRERIEDAAIRELREETCLKVPTKVLRGSITERRYFDDPFRSNRSHIITHVHKIILENVGGLPEVKGADDAEKAMWIPIVTVQEMIDNRMFFEDHASIIEELLF